MPKILSFFFLLIWLGLWHPADRSDPEIVYEKKKIDENGKRQKYSPQPDAHF